MLDIIIELVYTPISGMSFRIINLTKFYDYLQFAVIIECLPSLKIMAKRKFIPFSNPERGNKVDMQPSKNVES